ncbi:MAG TPA: hypothetical protein DEB10_13530, partial [Ruminococcaceae bacterium]|nr:hypothetical protein [Oscillospiraceae bacterium]
LFVTPTFSIEPFFSRLFYASYWSPIKKLKRFARRFFVLQEEEEEGGLTPADDEDAAKRKINRKEFNFLIGDQYQPPLQKQAGRFR